VCLNLKALRKIFTYLTHIHLSVPTIAISPWVQKGIIEHSGTNNGPHLQPLFHCGVYQQGKAFSLINFIPNTNKLLLYCQLWNLDDGVPSTPRVGFASTFEHLITNIFRDDTPTTLPNPAAG
jgi:phospholipase C